MKKIILLVSVFSFFFNTGYGQNCTLNCVSKVNVSLTPNACTASFTPYSFITDPSATPSPSCQAYVLKFEYPLGTHTFTPATQLDYSHQGYSMTYRIFDSVANTSCWGTVKVNTCNPCFYKTPPSITSFMVSPGPYIPGSRVILTAMSTDDKSIYKMEFYDYGYLIKTSYSASDTASYKLESMYASTHQFRVIAYDNCGDTATSAWLYLNTELPNCNDGYKNGNEKGIDCGGDCIIACPTPCIAPFSPSASVYGSDVTLTWSGSTSLYLLQITNTTTHQIIVSDPYASTPYHISLVDGNYIYKVKCKCDTGYSAWSDSLAFIVSQYHPDCYPPSNLSYSINGSAVTFSWTGSASQYQLEIKNTSTNAIIVSDLHATSPYTINLADGYYAFHVKSICNSLYSDWCDWIPFTIHDNHPYPCNIPTQLSSSFIGDQVHLTWTGNASQYQLVIEDAYTYSGIVSVYLDDTYFNTNLGYGDYRWKVRSMCNTTYSDWSSWNTFTLQYHHVSDPCDAPHHLSSAVNNGQVNMQWEGSGSEYETEINHIETGDLMHYKLLGTSTMTLPMESGSYKFKVKCNCGTVSSNWSDWASFTVTQGDMTGGKPKPVPCDQPFQLSSSITDQQVKISWSGIASSYLLEVETLDNTKSISLDVATSSFHTTLNNGSYQFRVKSKCNDQESEWSAWAYFDIGGNPASPGQNKKDSSCNLIQKMRVAYAGDSSFTFRWSPSGPNAVYTIEVESEFAPVYYQFKIDGLKDSVFRVTGLIPNTQYKVSIHVDCGNGFVSDNTILHIITLASLPLSSGASKFNCDIPSGTTVHIESPTTAVFSWLPVSGAKNYFIEIVAQDGTPVYNQVIPLNNVLGYLLSDLVPGGLYTFRIKGECIFSKSLYSTAIRFVMPSTETNILSLETRSYPQPFGLEVFPNPTHAKVNLHFNGSVKDLQRIQIININGQVLFDQKKPIIHNALSLSLEHYSPGIFFIKVTSDQFQALKKIVVQ